jgi:response regulator of citrate/malate metabolism
MVMYPHMEVSRTTTRKKTSSCEGNNKRHQYELTISYSDHGRGIRFVRAILE